MKTANNRFLSACILALALGVLPLYGCGGGGGGDGTEPSTGGSDPVPSQAVLDGVISKIDKNNAKNSVSEASRNYPRAGSITQSSNATNGITTDSVSVTASYEGGQVRYRVQNSSAGWSIDSAVDTVLERHRGDNWDGIELMKELPGGDLYVDVYSEDRVRQNQDYLAGGLWVYVPDSATQIGDFNLGVFGDGNDPFKQTDLAALTGTVTYRGEATLMYSEGSRIYFVDASVTLTVDFDRETVNGRIHSFYDEDGSPVSGVVVMLDETDIGDSNSGFFSGVTSVEEPNNTEGDGKWGGQFFGNGNGVPRIVGATFGVTTDSGATALGVLGALSPAAPAPAGFAPADQSAFYELVAGKRMIYPANPSYYVDFLSSSRFRESEDGDIYEANYTYEKTGPNSGRFNSNYDDGDRCTSTLMFDSAISGTLSYSCDDESGKNISWRLTDADGTPAPAPPSADRAGECRVGNTYQPGESCDVYGTGSNTKIPFRVSADGKGVWGFSISGSSIQNRGGSINGVNYTFVVSNQGNGIWQVDEYIP